MGQRRTDDEWLEHRCQLFERFTLPSVQSQTTRNFVWLVFVDSETPERFKERIYQYRWQGKFQQVPVKGDFTHEVRVDAVKSYLANGHHYLLTTRLDNDDAVCRRFVERVQEKFTANGQTEFLNFTHGYILQERSLYQVQEPSNAFITMVEPLGTTLQTVMVGDHTKLSERGPVRQIDGQPGWVMVVHGRNVMNKVYGQPCPLEKLQPDFEVRL